jgi:hypothetical protein
MIYNRQTLLIDWYFIKLIMDLNDLPAIDFETELLFLPNVVIVPLQVWLFKKFHLNYIVQEKIPKLMTTTPFIWDLMRHMLSISSKTNPVRGIEFFCLYKGTEVLIFKN